MSQEPLQIRFTDQEGRGIDLDYFLGSAAVLVVFWATWCPPCRKKTPHLLALYDVYAGDDFEIIGVSLDREEEKYLTYMTEQGITWPNQFDGKGWRNETARANGIKELPLSFLFDRTGKLIGQDLKARELESQLQQLFPEKA